MRQNVALCGNGLIPPAKAPTETSILYTDGYRDTDGRTHRLIPVYPPGNIPFVGV